jgi:hypothetical protein
MKPRSLLLSLAAILTLAGCHAASAQSASFTVSQHGHAVGTASYKFTGISGGYASSSLVNVSMQGLNYALSKDEQLDSANHLQRVVLSGTVNGSAVNVIAKPDGVQFLLNISANGRSTTTRLAAHPATVFLPDFDPGALETLLVLAVEQNNSDLWAIIPKQQGSIQPVTLATYPDEHGTLNGKAVTVHHLVATINNQQTDLFSSQQNDLMQAELPEQGFALVRTGFVLTPPKKPLAPPASTQQPPPQQQ